MEEASLTSTSMSTRSSDANNNGIEVYLRIRPSKNPSGYFHQDDIDESQILFDIPKKAIVDDYNSNTNDVVNNSKTKYAFQFNGIHDEKTTQDDIFRSIGAPAVRNVLDGFNSTVFAYGQTGSGKTFTITGGPERYADRGIIPRAVSMLFAAFQSSSESRERQRASYTCYVSYLELYNESGYDLLASDGGGGYNDIEVSRLDDMPKVTMLEDEDGNYHFRNLSVNRVNSEEDALNLLFLGDTNRAIGETEMNQSSSRSHCIFTMMVEKRRSGSDTVVRSKLNLVDLAGSERVHKTQSTGQTLKEAQYINTSLFFLEMVIVALHEKTKRGKESTHVPYRNSMMTSVLRDSLGGNCKTMMVATISPEAKQTEESISTCHFAQRVALVKNRAYVNEELEPELVIKRYKAEVKRLREEVKFLKGENGEGDGLLTSNQHDELVEVVRDYLHSDNVGDDDNHLNIGAMTLTKIQATYSIFKDAWKTLKGTADSTDIGHHHHDHHPEQHYPGSGIDTAITADHVKTMKEQILSLQQTLQKRDEEVKILVEMVKRGGTQQHIPNWIGKGGTTGPRDEVEKQGLTSIVKDEIVVPKRQQRSKFYKICGVERCADNTVLRDPSKAFNFFKKRYPGRKTLEENKELLRVQIQEATDVGKSVKASREEINIQKGRIECIRRKAALQQISDSLASADASLDEVGDHLQHHNPTEEMECLSIIEKEKRAYKQGFERLRELKGAIEHIKQLMEKHQRKLQKDFDTWYAQMYELMDCSDPIEDDHQVNNSIEGASPSSEIQEDQEQQFNEKVKHDSIKVGPSPAFKLPNGVRLTGNKEADEDIIAFYKAKEALLSRTKRRASGIL